MRKNSAAIVCLSPICSGSQSLLFALLTSNPFQHFNVTAHAVKICKEKKNDFLLNYKVSNASCYQTCHAHVNRWECGNN